MAAPTTAPLDLPATPLLKPQLGEPPFGFDPEPDPLPVYRSEVTLQLSSPIELILEDGEPLETYWHRQAMNYLIECLEQRFHPRTDFFVGGNMFVYYNEHQARNIDYKGPDVFFVWGRPKHTKREVWTTWDEDGRLPNVIVELMSPSTRRVDLQSKKTLYEQTFKTDDYFCYDPFTGELFGWTLTDGKYVALEPNEHGWLWSEQLQLWIGPAAGVYMGSEDIYLRIFTPKGVPVGTFADEAEAKARRAKADAARERRRVAALEAENARLRAELDARDNPSS